MSSVETGQMSAVETGQMSAAETGQMSAVETRQMSSDETRQMSSVARTDICLVATHNVDFSEVSIVAMSQSASWSIPSHPQDMQPLSLLRNFVNPECHFGELTTPSNPKIMIQFRSGIVSMRTPEPLRYQVFFLKILPRVALKIMRSQGPGPAWAGPHCAKRGWWAHGPL